MLNSLKLALKEASDYARPHPEKEVGGFILKKADSDEYKFIPVDNKHIGKPAEAGLYEPEPKLFGSLVVSLLLDGYSNFASFHSHPRGCLTMPSGTDLDKLFKGFPVNYIYSSNLEELAQYRKVPGTTMEEIFDPDSSFDHGKTIVHISYDMNKIEGAWNREIVCLN